MLNEFKEEVYKSLDEVINAKDSGIELVYVASDMKFIKAFAILCDEVYRPAGIYHNKRNVDFIRYAKPVYILTDAVQAGVYTCRRYSNVPQSYQFPLSNRDIKGSVLETNKFKELIGIEDDKALRELWKTLEFQVSWPRPFDTCPEIKEMNDKIITNFKDKATQAKNDQERARNEIIEEYITSIVGVTRERSRWNHTQYTGAFQYTEWRDTPRGRETASYRITIEMPSQCPGRTVKEYKEGVRICIRDEFFLNRCLYVNPTNLKETIKFFADTYFKFKDLQYVKQY